MSLFLSGIKWCPLTNHIAVTVVVADNKHLSECFCHKILLRYNYTENVNMHKHAIHIPSKTSNLPYNRTMIGIHTNSISRNLKCLTASASKINRLHNETCVYVGFQKI